MPQEIQEVPEGEKRKTLIDSSEGEESPDIQGAPKTRLLLQRLADDFSELLLADENTRRQVAQLLSSISTK